MDKLNTLIRRIKRRIRDLYYGLTGRFWYKYSTIKSRHLWHTWCDKDTILEMTSFEILQRFLEEESHNVNWDDCVTPEGEHVMTSWITTIRWFREVYLPYFKGENRPSSELNVRIIDEMTQHLNTIVRLRRYMWS